MAFCSAIIRKPPEKSKTMADTIQDASGDTQRDTSRETHYIQFIMEGVPAGYQVRSTTSIVTATDAWSVNWGDGEVSECYNGETSLPYHMYARRGNYTITLIGDITGISAVSKEDSPFITNNGKSNTFLRRVRTNSSILREIGDYTFKNCSNLSSVSCELASGLYVWSYLRHDGQLYDLDKIGVSAFENCISLETCHFLYGVSKIEKKAFYGCWKLRNSCIDSNDKLKLNKVSEIWTSAFEGCKSITTVEISKKIKNIDSRAFYGCSKINSVLIKGEKPVAHADDDGDFRFYGIVPSTTLQVYERKKSWTTPPVTRWSGLDVCVVSDWENIFDYTINNGEITISTYKDDDEKLEIPSEIDGYPVTNIANNAISNCPSLKIVTIPASIRSLGKNAFSYNTSLEEVIFKSDDFAISEGNFKGCTSLKSITIPNTVTSIPASFCQGCSSLVRVKMPGKVTTVGSYAFANCTSLRGDIILYGIIIGDYAFSNCPQLRNVYFRFTRPLEMFYSFPTIYNFLSDPSFFPHFAFSGAKAKNAWFSMEDFSWLINVVGELPYQSRNYGLVFDYNWSEIFSYTKGTNGYLIQKYVGHDTTVAIPSTMHDIPVTTICASAFAGTQVETIIVPETVTTLQQDAFSGCATLKTVIFKGESAPYCSSIPFTISQNLTIKKRPNAIGWGRENKWSWMMPIENIYRYDYEYRVMDKSAPNEPDEIEITKYIGGYDEIEVPAYIDGIPVTRIGNEAFRELHDFDDSSPDDYYYDWHNSSEKDHLIKTRRKKSISLPGTLKSIGNCAFADCINLERISLPDSIVNVEYGAFVGTGVKYVKWSTGATTIVADTFNGCRELGQIVLGHSLQYIEGGAFYECESLVALQSSNDTVDLPDTLLSIGDFAFYHCKSLQKITIPSSIKRIPYQAFTGCSSLESVILPEGLEDMEYESFAQCSSLKEITIPSTLTTILEGAFENCTSLENVFSSSAFSIDYRAFKGCTSLKELLQDENVAQGITADVGDYAFDGCRSLKRVRINQTCRYIGEGAFANCSSLERVAIMSDGIPTFGGSKDYFYNTPESACLQMRSSLIPSIIGSPCYTDNEGYFRSYNGGGRPILGDFSEQCSWHIVNGEIHIDNYNNVGYLGMGTAGIWFPNEIFFYPITKIGDRAFIYPKWDDPTQRPIILPFYGYISCWPSHLREIGSEAFLGACFTGELPPFPASLIKLGKASFAGSKTFFSEDPQDYTEDMQYSFNGDAPAYGDFALGVDDRDIPNPHEEGDAEYEFYQKKPRNISIWVHKSRADFIAGWQKYAPQGAQSEFMWHGALVRRTE